YGHTAHVSTPGISADGRVLVTTAADGTVRLWALPSGREIGKPLKFHGGAGDVSMSPDGRRFAVDAPEARRYPGVQIFDVATQRRVAALSQDDSIWQFARFTPDGRYLVGGSWKGWARLWSTKTWQPATGILGGIGAELSWESISPDGRTLATS